MKKALLIVGHGSKSEDAVTAFNQIIDEVRGKSSFDFVEGAHMELSKPGIDEVVDSLANRNPGQIIITPYFLYEGMHIKRDIPEIIKKLSKRYPGIDFIISKPIGYDPVMADIILRRAEESMQ